jgi:hypothetical protein
MGSQELLLQEDRKPAGASTEYILECLRRDPGDLRCIIDLKLRQSINSTFAKTRLQPALACRPKPWRMCGRLEVVANVDYCDIDKEKAPVSLQRLHALSPANHPDGLNTATFLAV